MPRSIVAFLAFCLASAALSAQTTNIILPVKDGDTAITGCVIPPPQNSKAQLWVILPGTNVPQPRGSAVAVSSDCSFSISQTVNEGEMLSIRLFDAAGNLIPAPAPAPVLVQSQDNEREHIDFFAGTVMSESETNFAQADTFLALNVDRALKAPGNFSAASEKPHTPGINTFFQARLTTIPVNASASTTITSAGGGSASSTSNTTPSFASVLSSQKVGHFEAGFYLPFMFAGTPKGHPGKPVQTFYMAPLGRFGFDTVAGNTSSTTATSTGTSNASGSSTTITTTALGTSNPLPSNYNFFLVGGRIGTATVGNASLHNVHYLDIGIGRFSNLENLVCLNGTNKCPSTTNELRYRPYRLSFEGYYQMPGGFVLGMSANVGAGIFDHKTNTDINNRAPGDVRFLFGYRFDAIKLIKALPTITQ